MVNVQLGERVVVTFGQRTPRTQHGEVVKVGRVWIAVQTDGARAGSTYRFRLDTQTDGSGIGYPSRFYTLDQWGERKRRAEANAYLRDQGLSIDYGSVWRGREVELANLIRPATTEETTS